MVRSSIIHRLPLLSSSIMTPIELSERRRSQRFNGTSRANRKSLRAKQEGIIQTEDEACKHSDGLLIHHTPQAGFQFLTWRSSGNCWHLKSAEQVLMIMLPENKEQLKNVQR
jgi:hypothetical protein